MEKVNGTFYKGKIILDYPIYYVSVFSADIKGFKGVKDGTRKEFNVITSASVKPEIVSAGKTLDKIETIWDIVLDGTLITTAPNKTSAELTVVKALTQSEVFVNFSSVREQVLEPAVKDGSATVKSCDNLLDACDLLLKLNNYDLHMFGLFISDEVAQSLDNSNDLPKGEFVGNFYLQSDLIPMLKPFSAAIKSGDIFSLLLTGEAGYGKTSAFKAIAEHLGIPYLRVDCSTMLNTTDWFGHMTASKGNTKFEETAFTKALEAGNTVIILDEFNRLPIEVLNALLPIMDDSAEITVKNRNIKVGGGILFGITLNEGVEYTGISGMIDKAVNSRIFGKVQVKPLPFDIEIDVINRCYDLEPEQTEKIVTVMHTLREAADKKRGEGDFISADLSTRTTKTVAWWVEKGLDIRTSLEYALFNFVGNDERTMFTDVLRIKGVL